MVGLVWFTEMQRVRNIHHGYDMTTLIISFRNFANALQNKVLITFEQVLRCDLTMTNSQVSVVITDEL